MRKIITAFFLMLGVTIASAQTAKSAVKDSVATNSGSSSSKIETTTPVKVKKLSKKESKELMSKNTGGVLTVPDCFGGHDSTYHAYKDSFNTIKPLCKDSITK